jgi:peptide/nickel transport system substrate-binding protein
MHNGGNIQKNISDKCCDMYVTTGIGDAIYLNPVLACDTASSSINTLIYNGLLKYDKDLNLVVDLAEDYKILNNGLSILFKLKKNILWHDGQPFTVQDVQFTYQKLIDEKKKLLFFKLSYDKRI